MTEQPRVQVYSKPGCHLCDVAISTVAQVCADLGERFEEIDISADPVLMGKFGDEIPVTFVDGRQHDYWRVDPGRLRAALGH